MVRALKTGIARAVHWVFIIMRVVLGLVLLFVLHDVVFVFLVFAMPALFLAWPYVKPRFAMLRKARRAAEEAPQPPTTDADRGESRVTPIEGEL